MPIETEIPWTYTHNPGTDTAQQRRDAVRFRVGDTEANDPQLSDGEVDALLRDASDSVTPAAVAAAQRLMARYTRHEAVTQGGVSVGSGKAEGYAKLLQELRREIRINAGGGFFSGGRTKSGKREFREDSDAVQPSFAVGMDDNPSGSLQDSDSPLIAGD